MAEHWLNVIRDLMHQFDRQVFHNLGNRVLSGPFTGMIIPDKPLWDDGNNCGKLLGTYEHELHFAIERAISRKPTVVINIGCAEGYYAIGLAMRLPEATVIASDVEQSALQIVIDFAHANKVDDRVKLVSGCNSAEQLTGGPEGLRLYVLDCEGVELELLDIARCPVLARSDVIVEVHDFQVPDCSATLIERFLPTHDVEVVKPRLPDLSGFTSLSGLPIILQVLLATDKRPSDNFWLCCWTRDFAVT